MQQDWHKDWGTIFLIAICVLTFVIGTIDTAVGNILPASFQSVFYLHQFWRLLTSVFWHFGLLHLVGNMYSLWFAGRVCSRFYGNGDMILIFLVSGVVGVTGSICVNMEVLHRAVLAAGASGGICGLIAAYLMYVRRHYDISWAAVANMIGPLALMSLLPGVDGLGHLFGALAGVVMSLILEPAMKRQW